ncbi:MAG TPA: tetraacyldisaccharide 4'-kinase [Persephonella sp.]|uniref:Tetraacyldisaccharide 4'-kinase n=1 Tax=Persephonella marina (strain DSM 14350 / EX-H1) TaxID=123214 RepID=C0QQU5_PERMH|nr:MULTISPECIES: tetraacyldisaccharide 4'-kinase [Persephonella]ACO03126.1 tetraacyldisaccharide 4'-kinase [Persephonella marina EX-H1]HCB68791.1 tetraacyldisaccharide 4'-kinase [Persephonella sp.]
MLLRILSYVYGAGAYLRRELYEKGVLKTKKLPRPVISIGNLSVGGTGKTPLTIYTARKLIEKGFNVCVLSRGYKRESKGTVVVSDGNNIFVNWRESGDEAFLIARNGIPVVVSSSRYEAGMKALNSMDVDVFLLDDGFQHFQLHRDIDIITVDATKPFWEDRLLPEGRLREPPEFYRYADIIVVSKIFSIDEIKKKKIIEKLDSFGKPYFLSTEKMNSLTDGKRIYSLEFLKGKKVGIFSGLGNNRQFFDAIKDLSERYSFEIVEFISFPDHYDYTDLRLDKKADIWLTTEKDLIKIEKNESIFALKYSIDLRPDYMDMIIGRLK